MTKNKVADLTGALLDAAVSRADGRALLFDIRGIDGQDACFVNGQRFAPSSDWSQGGPIIEREAIELSPGEVNDASPVPGVWWAFIRRPNHAEGAGPTPLIAAMRAYVAGKFGRTVELP